MPRLFSKTSKKSMSVPDERRKSLAKVFSPGDAIGIFKWEIHFNPAENRVYFFNKDKDKTSWGFPLRVVTKIPNLDGPVGDDDWECHIDPESGTKFYISEKRDRVQWSVPLLYRGPLKKLPFFQAEVSLGRGLTTKRSTLAELPEDQFDYSLERGSPRKSLKNAPSPPPTRRKTLDILVKSITIDQVLADTTICAGFHRFLMAIHAEENLLFWGSCEVFAKGEWKGMKVLGIEQPVSPEKDECDEATVQFQKQLTGSRASYRMGRPEAKTLLPVDEAQLIFDKFVKPGADMWVCVDMKVVKQIESAIAGNQPSVDDRTVFLKAQSQSLNEMADDLLHRFLKAAMAPGTVKLVNGAKFHTDEVLKFAIQRAGGRGDQML